MAAFCTGVATMSSLSQLRIQDTEAQRQHAMVWGLPRVEMPEASSYLGCLQSS